MRVKGGFPAAILGPSAKPSLRMTATQVARTCLSRRGLTFHFANVAVTLEHVQQLFATTVASMCQATVQLLQQQQGSSGTTAQTFASEKVQLSISSRSRSQLVVGDQKNCCVRHLAGVVRATSAEQFLDDGEPVGTDLAKCTQCVGDTLG